MYTYQVKYMCINTFILYTGVNACGELCKSLIPVIQGPTLVVLPVYSRQIILNNRSEL